MFDGVGVKVNDAPGGGVLLAVEVGVTLGGTGVPVGVLVGAKVPVGVAEGGLVDVTVALGGTEVFVAVDGTGVGVGANVKVGTGVVVACCSVGVTANV